VIGRHARRSGWALATVLAVATVGCSHGGDETTRPADALPTTTVPKTGDMRTNVVSDYEAFWNAYLSAADPMQPESPLLRAHATGRELQQVSSAFLARQSAGEVIRGVIDFDPVVVSLTGSTAVVRDCNFDHSVVVNVATGQTIGTPDAKRQLVVATLQFDRPSGTWKVATTDHQGTGCISPS
jgi:hypothetical protein